MMVAQFNHGTKKPNLVPFDDIEFGLVFKYNGNFFQKTEKQFNGDNAKNPKGETFFISPIRLVELWH